MKTILILLLFIPTLLIVQFAHGLQLQTAICKEANPNHYGFNVEFSEPDSNGKIVATVSGPSLLDGKDALKNISGRLFSTQLSQLSRLCSSPETKNFQLDLQPEGEISKSNSKSSIQFKVDQSKISNVWVTFQYGPPPWGGGSLYDISVGSFYDKHP